MWWHRSIIPGTREVEAGDQHGIHSETLSQKKPKTKPKQKNPATKRYKWLTSTLKSLVVTEIQIKTIGRCHFASQNLWGILILI
jgi:hypothetical protein